MRISDWSSDVCSSDLARTGMRRADMQRITVVESQWLVGQSRHAPACGVDDRHGRSRPRDGQHSAPMAAQLQTAQQAFEYRRTAGIAHDVVYGTRGAAIQGT